MSFNLINEVVKSSGMTEQQVFEHWLNEGLITLPQENNQPENNSDEDLYSQENEETTDGAIKLCRRNLSKIKVGMMWYDDDTVSEDLIEDKKVKSVVVAISGKTVYGDTFVEERLNWNDAKKFVRDFHNSYVKPQDAIWLEKQDLDNLLNEIDVINASISKLGIASVWKKDKYYWAKTEHNMPDFAYALQAKSVEKQEAYAKYIVWAWVRPVMKKNLE